MSSKYNRKCYVTSMAQISCQLPLCDNWFNNPIIYTESYITAIAPDYKQFIPGSDARRMSKLQKRVLCTSLKAMNDSGIKIPQAIITGTGGGCMENSEKFLIDIFKYEETSLKPSLFMQSTHNTLSSSIAIKTGCRGYNNTYTQNGISFDCALMDGWLKIKSGGIDNALIGAHDEVTSLMRNIMYGSHPEYSKVSEVSMSVILQSGNLSDYICEVSDVKIWHKPSTKIIVSYIIELENCTIITGINGNKENDFAYFQIINELSSQYKFLKYKHIFGDCYSSSAMAFYVGATILKNRHIPEYLKIDNGNKSEEIPERVLILNHSDNSDWSLVLLNSKF